MNKKVIAYSMAGVIMLALSSTDIYVSSLPQMALDFHVDPDMVNLTLSAFVFGMALGCPLCGFISDRYGRKKIYLTSLATYSIISLGIALVPHLMTIVFMRFIQGLFVSVFVIVSRQIIADISKEPKDQLYYTGILVSGVVLSPAIAPVIGAYIAHFLSWHWCFVFSAVLAATLLAVLSFVLKETNENQVPLPKISELYEEYAVFFRSRVFNVYSAVITLNFGIYFAFITMSSFIYIERLGVTPTMYSKVFLGLAAAYLFGTYIMQKLNKKDISAHKIVYTGLTISLIGVLISCGVYATHDKTLLLVLLTLGAAVVRCGYAMLVSTAQVIVMNAEDWRPGTAVGIIYFLQFAFGAIVSAIVSSMHSSPIYGMVAVMSVLALVSSALIYFSKR